MLHIKGNEAYIKMQAKVGPYKYPDLWDLALVITLEIEAVVLLMM